MPQQGRQSIGIRLREGICQFFMLIAGRKCLQGTGSEGLQMQVLRGSFRASVSNF